MTLKAYRLAANNGFVNPNVIAALGLPRHISQVDVYIIAATKVAGADLFNITRVGYNVKPRELELAYGYDIEAILAAGFHNQRGVYMTSMGGSNDRLVVRAIGDGQVKPAGRLHREPSGQIVLTGSTAEDGDAAAPAAIREGLKAAAVAAIKLSPVEAQLVARLAAGERIEKIAATGTFVIGREERGFNTARRPAVAKLIAHGLLDEHTEPQTPQRPLGGPTSYTLSADGRIWADAHPA